MGMKRHRYRCTDGKLAGFIAGGRSVCLHRHHATTSLRSEQGHGSVAGADRLRRS
jgi:hypothetical protein